MPVIRSGEAEIYYDSTGGGKPALVFIHGFACDHSDWDFQKKRLSATFQVVACDLRGRGRSTGESPGCTIEALAADVKNLLNGLGLNDAIVIGHSMGCRVALETWRQSPDVISGVVLVDGSQLGESNPAVAIEKARVSLTNMGYPAWAKRTYNNMFFPDCDVSLRERIVERALRLDPDFGISLFSNLCGWDAGKMEPTLSALKVPLLLIQSTGTNITLARVPMKKGDTSPWLDLAKRLVPGVRVEIVTGPGHFTMLEAPDTTSGLIDSFAASIRKR